MDFEQARPDDAESAGREARNKFYLLKFSAIETAYHDLRETP